MSKIDTQINVYHLHTQTDHESWYNLTKSMYNVKIQGHKSYKVEK